MALMKTPTPDFGSKAPNFSDLRGVDEKLHNLEDVRGENGLLVLFICNHCPYVKAVIDVLVEDGQKLMDEGIGVVAIMSNDVENYPADSFDNMKAFAKAHDFPFPYVIDEDQSVARAYGAICTPDIFGFNADLELQYRGRVDSRGANLSAYDEIESFDHEMLEAMRKIAKTGKGPQEQKPSMGCSIKWRD